jgi:hypothetical protein
MWRRYTGRQRSQLHAKLDNYQEVGHCSLRTPWMTWIHGVLNFGGCQFQEAVIDLQYNLAKPDNPQPPYLFMMRPYCTVMVTIHCMTHEYWHLQYVFHAFNSLEIK